MENMKDFAPYNEALELKNLGFDEECWCYFINDVFYDSRFLKNYEYLEIMPKHATYTLAPLFSQAFRFFREKHGYFTSPTQYDDDVIKKYDWHITKNLGDGRLLIEFVGYHNTYEEAELACLQKLIQIVKNEKHTHTTN